MLNSLLSPAFWFQVLASTTPVLLATLAANIVSQAGIFNLAIEGTMLICALTGVLISAFTQNLLLGMLGGVVIGVFFSFVLGYFALILRGPMNACGVAINLLATGGTVFVMATITGSKANTSALQSLSFPNISIPLLKDIPVVGEILSGHNLITYLGWLFVIITWVLLYRTRLGRNMRAVGENEEAAKSAGISVNGMKFTSLAFCGLFCAFAGMYLSMGSLNMFTANMTAGRGYLSLAMNAMSQGNPVVGFFSSLLYGFSNTSTVYLQLYSDFDLKLIQAFPYIFIIVVLLVVQVIKNINAKRRASVSPLVSK